MRPLDAYHGNHHTFWPRLYSALGRHSRRGLTPYNPTTHLGSSLPEAPASPSSGLSDSTAANAVENRPSDIGVGSDGRTVDAGVGTPSSLPVLIPASILEVAELLRRRR